MPPAPHASPEDRVHPAHASVGPKMSDPIEVIPTAAIDESADPIALAEFRAR